MENVSGCKRGITATENGSDVRATSQELDNPASMIAELERAVGRQTTKIAELKADPEERNAKLAVLEAECRRVRGGRGENGVLRSGNDAKGGLNIREASLKNLCST